MATFLRTYSRDKRREAEDPLQLVDEIVPGLESEGAHNELATAWRLRRNGPRRWQALLEGAEAVAEVA